MGLNWVTFWQIAPTLVSLAVLIIGWIYALGKMNAMMATKQELQKVKEDLLSNISIVKSSITENIDCVKIDFKEYCKEHQTSCSLGVGNKIDDLKSFVAELKTLVVELHDKQGIKIEDMDRKRENAKQETSEEFKKIHRAIGQIEGQIKKYNGSG